MVKRHIIRALNTVFEIIVCILLECVLLLEWSPHLIGAHVGRVLNDVL
jgi:hypothetical protein